MRIRPPVKEFTGSWRDTLGRGEYLMLKELNDKEVDVLWFRPGAKRNQYMYLTGVIEIKTPVATGPVFNARAKPPKQSFLGRLFRRPAPTEPRPWGVVSVHYLDEQDVFLYYNRADGGTGWYRMKNARAHRQSLGGA